MPGARPTSAPARTSLSTTAALFPAAAHISAVWPCVRSVARTSAPPARSTSTAAASPVRAAVISGVRPPAATAFGWAPASSNCAMMPALPATQASESGVTP